MEIIFLISLGILGAAFIAGGIVAYRKSKKVSVKVIAAALIAAGVVMEAIFIFGMPVSRSVGP